MLVRVSLALVAVALLTDFSPLQRPSSVTQLRVGSIAPERINAVVPFFVRKGQEELERERKSESLVDPAAVVAVMEVIGQRFAEGQPTTLVQVCEQPGLPEQAASRMFSGLVLENLLHRLDGPTDTVALSRPPESITGVELLEVAFRLVDSGQPATGSRLLDRLRQVQRDLVATTTLAGLVEQRQTG